MSVLQALDGYYGRMERRGEAAARGWSSEPIGTVVVLGPDGSVIGVTPHLDEKGKRPRPMRVPKPFNRQGTGSTPFLFWDNTAYALGVSTKEPGKTARDHAAFRSLHLEALATATDEALIALHAFFQRWHAEMFRPPFEPQMLAWNLVFRLDGVHGYIHDSIAAKPIIDHFLARYETEGVSTQINQCLVTGQMVLPRILHTKIKGVSGTSNPEVPFVSFNKDAFESYGKKQAENAPVSSGAVSRYASALTSLLDRDESRNRLARTLGDATVVFWADTSPKIDEDRAKAAEETFAMFADPAPAEAEDFDDVEAAKLNDALDKLAAGRPVENVRPGVDGDTTFHVLGLAPNAARLSVRYWVSDRFEAFAQRLGQHHADLKIEPAPFRWKTPPSVSRLLVKTAALQEKFENIPNALAGETMRAILTGGAYPRTLLTAAIIRLRAGDDASTGWHAAVIKACLTRDFRLGFKGEADERRQIKEPPVSLDRDNQSDAYQLGRLFAALETAQRLALGKVNATIRDRYFGAASATPAGVFPLLLRGVQNHTAKLRKDRKDVWIEKEIGEIVDRLPPELTRSLKLEAQGRFAIGYYHQRQSLYTKNPKLAETEAAGDDNDNGEGSEE